MTPEEQQLIRSRQLGRAKVLAWLLGGLVILVFAIAVAKIRSGMA